MKPLFYLSLLFAACSICCSTFAQPVTKGTITESTDTLKLSGNAYALITGISRYEDINTYRSLRYADEDAREFYRYLVAQDGGRLPSANVDTLMNEKASFMEFWKKFNRFKDKLQKGDVFYIYFSGHGDAYRADEAYLLAYDAPPGNDRNNYSTGIGLIDIHKLKVRIEELTRKGVQVVLITDACRTNELPGKEEGRSIAYQQIFERKAGEIQFISCSSNQVSFEDARWGGGRGLFSWHFINGLKGMADTDPEDGEVTLAELYDYVKKNVNRASYDKTTKEYKQTPRYCCTERDAMVLSTVTAEQKQALAQRLQAGNWGGMTKDDALLAVNRGGGLEEEMKAAGLTEWYQQYMRALNNDELIGSGSAYELLKKVWKHPKLSPQVINELKFELSSLLMGDVSKVIRTYLNAAQNNNLYTYPYFMTAANKLRVFREVADTAYYSPLDVQVNLLFLEGHANWRSDKRTDQYLSLRKVDSAIALKPQAAYLYNLKGLMHSFIGQPEEAEKAYRTGVKLAPNWLYPIFNLGVSFADRSRGDSAMKYFRRAIIIDSNYQTTYAGIGMLYYHTYNKPDSAVYFIKKGLNKDPNDPYLWTLLGHFHLYRKLYPEALQYYYQAMKVDSKVIYPLEGAMQVHVRMGNTDSTAYYVNKMTSLDPENPVTYQSIGNLALEYDMDSTALSMFATALYLDSMSTSSWKGYAEAASRLGKDTLAFGALYKSLEIDSLDTYAYNQMGNVLFKMEEYEAARNRYAEAIRLAPDVATYYHNYGEASFQLKEYETAGQYFRSTIKLDKTFGDAYYRLAQLSAEAGRRKEALQMLEKAISLIDYNIGGVRADIMFKNIREEPEFEKILTKKRKR